MATAQAKTDRVPVYLRVRPCAKGVDRGLRVLSETAVEVLTPITDGPVHRAEFHRIFNENSGIEEVFKVSVLPLLENILVHQRDGALIAYGASGSGKTHTISGPQPGGSFNEKLTKITRQTRERQKPIFEANERRRPPNVGQPSEGVLPLVVHHIFDYLRQQCENISRRRSTSFSGSLRASPANVRTRSRTKTPTVASARSHLGPGTPGGEPCSRIRLSVIQVYNEVVTDLLNSANTKPLCLSQDSSGRCSVRDCVWRDVSTEQEALAILDEARRQQKVAATKLNEASSRSHFIVFVEIHRPIGAEVKVNQMIIADLAGNERPNATGSTGLVLRQAGFINCSLLVLGRCIEAVRRGQRNVPFRDSKLTRLLGRFLTSKGPLLALLACVSPDRSRVDDTLATIKFAALASELTQPAEVVKRLQETRRRSIQIADEPPGNTEDSVTMPAQLYQALQEDLALAERIVRENEELRRNLQMSEEAAENCRLMYEDRLATLRNAHRSGIQAVRTEHAEAREAIERELRQHCKELSEKNATYRNQAAQMAQVLEKRLYPELKAYRSRFGLLEQFPPLSESGLREYERAVQKTPEEQSCMRCGLYKIQLNEARHQVEVKTKQEERIIDELRSERELRVLLQEQCRTLPAYTSWSSNMELTCKAHHSESTDEGSSLSIPIDSGRESGEGRATCEDFDVAQLRDEVDELRARLVQQIAMLDHFKMNAHDKQAELEQELTQERSRRQLVEMDRDQLVHRLQEPGCGLDCDRCRQLMRLREVPRTAPSRPARCSPSVVVVRESKLAFTPVFRGTRRLIEAVSPQSVRRVPRRRRLVDSSPSTDEGH